MIEFDNLTLADLLTAAGAGIAGTIVTLLVDVWKAVFEKAAPKLSDIDGVFLTAVFALILYVLVGIEVAGTTTSTVLALAFSVFLAWLFCTAAAIGVHKVVVKPITG